MPRLREGQTPKYRRHRASGQAIVTLSGEDHYLGPYGTKASHAEYDRVIGEWLRRGRTALSVQAESKLTICTLLAAYLTYANERYARSTGELACTKLAMGVLRRLYGSKLVDEFGPLALQVVRDDFVKLGWSRQFVNAQTRRVRRIFSWGVSREMVPPTVSYGLREVKGLRQGDSKARESDSVMPVAAEHVEATLPYLSQQVQAMVRLQLLTGARPGEICIIRACDIDTTSQPWVYRPESHKTKHHGHHREIFLGPKAQEVVEPLLKFDTRAYLFSPSDAEEARRQKLHERRETPPEQGNNVGTNRSRSPKRQPGDRYDVTAYRRAIARACDRAFPPPEPLAKADGETTAQWRERLTPEQRADLGSWRAKHRWHPHQLRHTAATELRKQYGLEAAQVILGHQTLTVTQVYAEKNVAAARKIMSEVG